MMNHDFRYKVFLAGLSPWIILGAVLVMLPIVALMTLQNINHRKLQHVQLMIEKGGALIRAFEAGTRMGMRGGHGKGFKLQRLLFETAAQPDIAHLLVVAIDGTVMAHNRMDRVGVPYDRELDMASIHASGKLAWRRITTPAGEGVFEVYGKFAPLAKGRPYSRHGHMMRRSPARRAVSPMVIFVGFKTDGIDAAQRADMRHSVVMAIILILVGCAGVLLLFLTQNYRSARISLARERVFSDNLVSHMPMGLVALDHDGRVTAVNSVAEQTLAVMAVDLIGRDAKTVIPSELTTLLTDTDTPVETEVRCPVGAGHLPLDVSAATLTDDNGQGFARVILFKDLTEIRNLHQELEKNRRLASVGRLAAGVAHEIRNPLSSIKGFATYFKEKYQRVDKDQEIATIMIEEVDRLNRVVGQLLEFSRPIQLHVEPVAIKPFLENAFRLVARQSRQAGVTMDLELSDDDLCLTMDADKMSQVMLNLFLNALDAMATGGRLTVRLSGDANRRIRIRVIDTGSGIDPEEQPHIFEPYYSTKQTGTGLGLAIVHNIVKAHRGEILVESRPGGGTTVQIDLPVTEEA